MSEFISRLVERLRTFRRVTQVRNLFTLLLIGSAVSTLCLVFSNLQTEHAQRQPLGPQCHFSDECAAPLVCNGGYCSAACKTSRDCSNGWLCVDGTRRGEPAPGGTNKICTDPALLPAQPPGFNGDNTNFPGFDMEGFPIGTATARTCQSICEDDPKCQAYTYVKAGYQATTAYCYLKSEISKPVRNTCCTSGIVRGNVPWKQ